MLPGNPSFSLRPVQSVIHEKEILVPIQFLHKTTLPDAAREYTRSLFRDDLVQVYPLSDE